MILGLATATAIILAFTVDWNQLKIPLFSPIVTHQKPGFFNPA
ncbi:hypothetical protein PLAN_41172 [Planktothrix rubescens CCAP 1459/22]|uniref:Uncharacterized protein n=1 Tax=Planktothrix rubescens CCAP 1459/22 TaxID=329571 RepID=A0A6J7ZLQ9_PLARU|nr:hypothetical protein PLAN_41172 [Planktothrix rubescens NIVA-CYA 18]CAD0220687.1 conserved hypothetical protein [Planktothrix agardhii]